MAHVHISKLSLRIRGDTLVPEELTALLGATPTFSYVKGEEVIINKAGRVRIADTGMWLLNVDDHSPENLDGQLHELFDRLTDDLDVWRKLDEDFSVDLFCGLFTQYLNEGFSISANVMQLIADRRLPIGFDIYGGKIVERPT